VKHLIIDEINDNDQTSLLSQNKSLHRTSYPHLKNSLDLVLGRYELYKNNQGNALNIDPIVIPAELKVGLLKHYESPPVSLKYITKIRKCSNQICPMCGAPRPFSLDHVLPKEDYAEFAIFSRNLVPACICNSKRGKRTRNILTGARVLHPYYDDCLKDRLLSCNIVPSVQLPLVKITEVVLTPEHALANSIRFHTNNVILPSGLIEWLSSQWSSLVEYPAGIIHTLPRTEVQTELDFNAYLTDALARYDKSFGTPNNCKRSVNHRSL
jgi:hypothetical protein